MNVDIYQQFALEYDKMYDDKFYRQYALFIKKNIDKNKIKNVQLLDLACGTGRLIKELNSFYRYIEGMDASKKMLFIAQKNNENVKFYNQNIVNFNVERKYNVITCTFDSINYITAKKDLNKTFKNIANHLEQNGILVFDFNTIFKKVEEKIKKDDVVYFNTIKNGYWDIKIQINKENKFFEEKHKERLYSFKEIDFSISKSNLKIIDIFADFDNKIKTIKNQQRLFVVVKKQ